MSDRNPRPSRTKDAPEAERQQRAAERRTRLLMVGGVLATLVAVVALVTWALTRTSAPAADQQEVPTVADPTSGQAAGGTPGQLDGYGIVVGQVAAPTTVTVYEDLQCPACADFEAQVGADLAEAVDSGEVRLEYRLVSFLDQASTNDYSSRALNAALAVLDTAGVDAFRTFHDDLFADQPAEGGAGFEDDELVARAVEAGATESEVREPIQGKVFAQWIVDATEQMRQDEVRSTPTIRIDGEDATQDDLVELLEQ